MRAYYGSRISDHMVRTPENYLVCKDVPIARTGVQQYQGSEFGGEDSQKLYNVERPEEEVFSRAAMASFEGKPVVDEHPQEDITSDNALRYLKGTCRNVHRGEGPFSNCIMADLIIYDDGLIKKIEDGKRDISCGYDCLWVPKDENTYVQREIRGNHVAVVEKGRAGHKVSIRDSKGGTKKMNKQNRASLWGRILHAFASDADTTPEDLAAAAKLNPKADDDDEPKPQYPPQPAPAPQPPKPTEDDDEDLKTQVAHLTALVQGLVAKMDGAVKDDDEGAAGGNPAPVPPKPEPDALDALEAELKGGAPAPQGQPQPPTPADDEGQVDLPPQKINVAHGEADDGEDIIEPGQGDENAAKEVRDAALKTISNLKPIIAALPKAQRKAATDSMAALLRGNIQDTQYGILAHAQQYGHQAHDANPIMDDVQYGRMIRDKFNPHYKKED